MMYNFLTDSSLSPTIIGKSYGAFSPLPTAPIAEPRAEDEFDWSLIRWPSRRPRLEDIYWIAGVVEGEGSFTSGRVAIPQKDREILDRVQEFVGGRVFGPIATPSVNGTCQMHRWYATGERGRGIARTLYHLMSSRRQAQIRAFLNVSRPSDLPEPLSPEDPTRYLTDFEGLPPDVLP